MNEQLQKDLKHFEYVTKDRFEMVEELLKKGYDEKEVIDAYNDYSFKPVWNGNALIGILMICLAICIGISITSTLGSFRYELDSTGDFLRLNEWVLKPLLSLVLLATGVNILINRGFFNKRLKMTMIVIFVLFIISSMGSNTPISLLFGAIGIVLFITLRIKKRAQVSEGELVVNTIKSSPAFKSDILKTMSIKSWNGSTLFVFLFLAFIVLLSSSIDISRPIASGSSGGLLSFSQMPELSTLDQILSIGLRILYFGSFATAMLVNINLKKFKWVVLGLVGFAILYIVLCVFHRNMQMSIIPSLLIVFAGLFTLYTHSLLPKKQAKDQN